MKNPFNFSKNLEGLKLEIKEMNKNLDFIKKTILILTAVTLISTSILMIKK
jgi:hypothetical protein